MINNAVKQIKTIRGQDKLNINENNANEYRILINETDGMTAYYFSCPIYRQNDKKLIDPKFSSDINKFISYGSNSVTEVIENKIHIKNKSSNMTIDLIENHNFSQTENCIQSKNIKIYPTYNGIALEFNYIKNEKIKFTVMTGFNYQNKKFNKNYLAFMQDQFVPFASISAICAMDKNKKACFPISINYKETAERTYEIEVNASGIENQEVSAILEINMYAQKMIFDTTVESKIPDKNNVFGSTAFIGNSEEYGQQWLYSRIDTMQLMDLNYYLVKEANLYIPRYGFNSFDLEAYKIMLPWCSFGSTWNTKLEYQEFLSQARTSKDYKIIKITDIVKDILRLNAPRNPGVVIRAIENAAGYEVLATSDNYFTPQILEIKLKNN